MNQEKTLAALQLVNTLLEAAAPVAAAAISLGVALIHQIKSAGTDIAPFQEEIIKLETKLAGGVAVDDAWRAQHGLPAWGSV